MVECLKSRKKRYIFFTLNKSQIQICDIGQVVNIEKDHYMYKKLAITSLTLTLFFSHSNAASDQLDSQETNYVKLLASLDDQLNYHELEKVIKKRIQAEGKEIVIVRPIKSLYELESSAGNIERASKIKNYMSTYNIDPVENLNIKAITGYQCKASCIMVLTQIPLRSYEEIGEAFGGLRALNSKSAYAQTGINSPETFRLLYGPINSKEILASEYAKILSEKNPETSINSNRKMINESITKYGFIEGFVKPLLVSREIYYKNGESQVVNSIDTLMNRYGLKNDFSVFAQRDFESQDQNGKGNRLNKKIEMVSNQYQKSNKEPSFSDIVTGVGVHYINSRIEDVTGSNPKALGEEAKKVKTVGDATLMMGKIFLHTAKDAVIKSNEKLTKISETVELAEHFNDIKGDKRDQDTKTEKQKPTVENKQESKTEPKKEEKKEVKKEEPKKEKEEKVDREPKEKKDPLPTKEEHKKGEEYLLPDAIVVRPDLERLSPEEREAEMKRKKEIMDSAVIFVAKTTDVDTGRGIIPKQTINPINSTPVIKKEYQDPMDLEKIRKKKLDITTNPVAPGLKDLKGRKKLD